MLQGRKVHPQRCLSVSPIKWLNLLKALSSCPFYCCCNHCLEKHTSALHVLVCKSLNSSRKLCEQTCSCLLARWHLDHPGLTMPLSLSLSQCPTSIFAWSESFSLTFCLFALARMVMLHQLSALSAARTDSEDMDTTNNCSFHMHCERLPPGLHKTNPPVSIRLGQSCSSSVSHLCMHTHTCTHTCSL